MWNAAVPSDAGRIGAVRHAAQQHLRSVGVTDQLEPIILMISELVTNAFRHGAPPATISVTTEPGKVHVSVCDGSTAQPRVMPVEPTRIGGNGMRIVESLSTSWGCDNLDDGKAVWFEVAV